MFKSEAGLFLSANNNVNSAKTLINECKRLIIDFDLEGNSDCNHFKRNINECNINALVTKIENTKESLMKLDQDFASEYMTLLQKFLQTSTIDTSNMSDEEKMQYSIKMNGYARDYNQTLLYMLEKYEDSDMLTEEMKQQLTYQKQLIAQYDIQDKMAVLDSTSDEYIKLFKQNAECDKNLINLNPSLTKEKKESYLKEYEIQYNKNLKSLNDARDARVKRELDEKELQKLYDSKEDNNGFFHPFVESEIEEAILDKKIAMGIATEDEIAYKNMNGWDRFWTDTGTFAASTFTGLFNITEGIGDAFVMLGSAISVVDKDWASDYIKRDISGELYQGIQLSNNMNSYSAYGTWHAAGEMFGDLIGKAGITFAAPWASAALYGLDAMGQSAESSLNNGDDYWKAFAKSTVSGIGGAVEGYGMGKLNLGVRKFMSSGALKTIGSSTLSKAKSLPKTISNMGSLKTIAAKGMQKTVKTVGTSFVSTILEPDAMLEVGSVIFDNAIDGDHWTKTVKEAGAVFMINWGMNYATELAFGSSSSKSISKPEVSKKLELDDLSYEKVGPLSSSYYMLESNVRKYVYVNTNTIDGLNDSIKQNGLYHFTSESACDKILDSGYVKKSGYITSYGNKKSFFFNGVPDVGSYATNLGDLPLRATAVKITPDSNLLDSASLKIRSLDDLAITYDGNLNFSPGQASKEYFCLFKENDKLVYKNVSKEFYDSYPTTEAGKLLDDFVSKKSNVSAIKNDFYYNLSTKSSGVTEIGASFNSVLNNNVNNKNVVELFDSNPTDKLFDFEVTQKLFDSELPNSNVQYMSDSNFKALESQISLANYHTGNGRFYTIQLDDFDGISKELLDQIDDPSSIRFKVGDQVYSYLDVKQQVGISPTATSVNVKALESQISMANYHTGNGRFYTIQLDNFDGISKELLDQIDNPSSVMFKVGDQVYSYLDFKQQIGIASGLAAVNVNVIESQISAANYYAGKGNFYEIKVNNLDELPSDFYNNLTNPENVKFNFNNRVVDANQVAVAKYLGYSNIDVIDAIKQNPVDFYLNNVSGIQSLGLDFDDCVQMFDVNINKYGVDDALGAALAYNDKNIFLVTKAQDLIKNGMLDPNDVDLISNLIYRPSANIDSNALQNSLYKYLNQYEIDTLDQIIDSGKMDLTPNEAAAIYQYQKAGGHEIINYNRGNGTMSLDRIETLMNDFQANSGTGVLRDLSTGKTIVEEIDSAISKNLNKQTVTAVRYCNGVGSDLDLTPILNGTMDPKDLVGSSFDDFANTSYTVLNNKETSYSMIDPNTGQYKNKIKIEAVIPSGTGAFIDSQGGLNNYTVMEFLTKRNTKTNIVNAYWDVDGRLVLQTLITPN